MQKFQIEFVSRVTRLHSNSEVNVVSLKNSLLLYSVVAPLIATQSNYAQNALHFPIYNISEITKKLYSHFISFFMYLGDFLTPIK
jgi:hypothetical protein